MVQKEEAKKSIWATLSRIDCNAKVEKKGNLTYLSWAWAWGIVKENYPDARYEVKEYSGRPYLCDEVLGYMVTTEVTIEGETLPMSLPVMDGNHKAMKSYQYQYQTRSGVRTVEAASMFDINTAIMRCLTKNLALFGLGHYIYAGEDLPVYEEKNDEKNEIIATIRERISNASSNEELMEIFQSIPTDLPVDTKVALKASLTKKKNSLK